MTKKTLALCRRASIALAICLLALPASGEPETPQKSVLVQNIPHIEQKPGFSGEACVAMALGRLGAKIGQDAVFDRSGVDPAEGRGCSALELAAAARRIGFEVGRAVDRIDADKAAAGLEAEWRALHDDLARGVPSVVATSAAQAPGGREHFWLVAGYDGATDEVIYDEPALAASSRLRMKRSRFLAHWPLADGPAALKVVRIRLEPKAIAVERPASQPTHADYAQHVMRLKERLPGDGFAIIFEPPFVVLGDEAEAAVRRRSAGTVRWAVDLLEKEYFEKPPDEIIDIWLFRDKASYEKHALALFGERPSTPFGYYSSSHRALVMNIATGGGTLVHEIVHPFMRANFLACPPWFNEGLASLYEQCHEVDGHIRGLTNWRLAGLKAALESATVPSFERLTSMSEREFYDDGRGIHYAAARYLCYYLQEKGLLARYYREFVAHQREDRTGYATLKRVLGESDMADFEKRWGAFVRDLTFP